MKLNCYEYKVLLSFLKKFNIKSARFLQNVTNTFFYFFNLFIKSIGIDRIIFNCKYNLKFVT